MKNFLDRWMPDLSGYNSTKFSKDLLASLVVFLVAVPLGLGIAVVSGAPIISGIIACAVGGIVAGLFAGAPLQVSGPAAGLTLLTYGIVQQFGWQAALSIFILSGIFQVVFGVLGIARTCLMISPAVIKGMLAGIGLVIALAQFHILLGSTPESSALKNLLSLPHKLLNFEAASTIIGVITLAVLVLWEFLPGVIKKIPGALAAIIIGTLVSLFMGPDIARIQLPEKLFTVITPAIPGISEMGPIVLAALSLAVVASVESLLCAVATDKMHSGPRAKLDQELVAQGAANMVSGVLGGLPITGVIVRSSANIQSGGVTRVSALLHGVWVVLFIALFAGLVKLIPMAALAGLLVYVGLKLVNFQHIRELKSHREELIYVVTILGVISIGLLQGVGLGVALTFVLLFYRLSHIRIDTYKTSWGHDVRIDGVLTFINVPQVTKALNELPSGEMVNIDLAADYMDHAAFEAIHSWKMGYERTGGIVKIEELQEEWYGKAAGGSPIVQPYATGRYALASVLEGSKNETAEEKANQLVKGVLRFRRSLGEALKPLYHKLGKGQNPNILFVTCCDSRIDPAFITASKPGELFVLRNIGNIVPPIITDENDNTKSEHISVLCAVDYAVQVLNVENIVICGHSDCGAIKALLSGDYKKFPSVAAWLDPVVKHIPKAVSHCQHDQPHNIASRWNVIEQLENLKHYPAVKDKLANNAITLHGWYFDIESAEIHMFDSEKEIWVSMDDVYSNGDFGVPATEAADKTAESVKVLNPAKA